MTAHACAGEDEAAQLAKHEGLAVRFAKRMGLHDDDGLQAARIGLLEALRRFDPARGTAFSTYAAYWLRAELQRERALRQVVGINASALERRRRYNDARGRLEGAPIERLATAARVNESQARVFEQLGRLDTRDLMERGSGGLILEERLDGGERGSEDLVLELEQRELLRVWIERLKERRPKWARVVELRLDGKTLEQVGRELGVSRQRVQQLETSARTWLRRQAECPAGG